MGWRAPRAGRRSTRRTRLPPDPTSAESPVCPKVHDSSFSFAFFSRPAATAGSIYRPRTEVKQKAMSDNEKQKRRTKTETIDRKQKTHPERAHARMYLMRARLRHAPLVYIGLLVATTATCDAQTSRAPARSEAADKADFEAVCGACHTSSMVSDIRTAPEWHDTR